MHAKYSPSDSARWLNCFGAIEYCETLPKQPESDDDTTSYAGEGTWAHEVAHIALSEGIHPGDFIPTPPDEMIRHINGYVDFINELSVGCDPHYERVVDLDHLIPGMFGTADAIIFDEVNCSVTIVDLKYGQGVPVVAENNTQLMLYASGAVKLAKFPIDTIELIIYQPRVFDGLPAARVWETNIETLERFEQRVKEAYRKQDSKELVPGEAQCRWCPGAATCPALRELALELAAEQFEPFKTKDTLKMEIQEIEKAMRYVNLVMHWCKTVEARAQELLEHGHKLEGFKLVRGRSIRRWKDEMAALEVLHNLALSDDDLYTKKFISPTQAENLLTKEEYQALVQQELVYKPEGKLTIAVESDPRPNIDPFEEFK